MQKKYRIVIADDEDDMREHIANRIRESCPEFELVGEAENGQEALDAVRNLKPDILITDICMPLVSGLELIRQIKEADERIQTVIISGYDEFSYAKEAISMGVKDYLLKPFLPEELLKVLDRIRDDFRRQEQLAQNMQELTRQMEQHRQYSKEKLLQEILEENLTLDEIRLRGQEVGLDTEASFYSVGLVHFLDTNQLKKIAFEKEVLEMLLDTIHDHYFSRDIQCLVASHRKNQLLFVFSTRGKVRRLFDEAIEQGLERMNASLENYYGFSAKATLGGFYTRLDEIRRSYQEALSVWKAVLNPQEVLLRYESWKKGQNESQDMPDLAELEKELMLQIKLNDKSRAVACMDGILEYHALLGAGKTEFVSISLTQLVLKLTELMKEADDNANAWEDEGIVNFFRNQFTFGSLLEAKTILEEYVIRCCEQFAANSVKHGDRLMTVVKAFLQENLADENLSLEMVADTLHFSPNYIRHLFKSKTGESFTDYLFRIRMELAQELLDNPSYKIQEIAEKTGYSDQRYFSRCFRKYKNCTPTEYRKKI